MKSPMETYWDSEYKRDVSIFGDEPSILAIDIASLRIKNPPKRILDIGCGYGRDLFYYVSHGMETTGIDISEKAISLAYRQGVSLGIPFEVLKNDFLCETSFQCNSFDFIVSYELLHLLNKIELKKAIEKIYGLLTKNGLTGHIILSDEDFTFGRGTRMSENTYEWVKGKIVHYYQEEELRGFFYMFKILRLERIEVKESHDGYHVHNGWFILAVKD
jgi:cyclopropane fatty-acyl-phospholipid synthase-like methyltransferase